MKTAGSIGKQAFACNENCWIHRETGVFLIVGRCRNIKSDGRLSEFTLPSDYFFELDFKRVVITN